MGDTTGLGPTADTGVGGRPEVGVLVAVHAGVEGESDVPVGVGTQEDNNRAPTTISIIPLDLTLAIVITSPLRQQRHPGPTLAVKPPFGFLRPILVGGLRFIQCVQDGLNVLGFHLTPFSDERIKVFEGIQHLLGR